MLSIKVRAGDFVMLHIIKTKIHYTMLLFLQTILKFLFASNQKNVFERIYVIYTYI